MRTSNPGSPSRVGLQAIEPETARSVLLLNHDVPVGAGCLVSATDILTCRHVVEEATGHIKLASGLEVSVILVGVVGQPAMKAEFVNCAPYVRPTDLAPDIALLRIPAQESARLAVRPVEFASPIVHSDKDFAVMGFPARQPFGAHARGNLRAADRNGLIQMDGSAEIAVAPGFSGAPVWCRALQAFVGIVVATDAEPNHKLAWCIPSRTLSRFHPTLPVKFRIPTSDRPIVHDQETDDPNVDLFGQVSDNGERRLTASITREGKLNRVDLRYECLEGFPPRGEFVTFITYPDFEQDDEDAYELFERLVDGVAETYIFPSSAFTVAAVGDAGDSALTVDLMSVKGGTSRFYR
jgi:Trypsin-like peptidase domain